MNKEQAARFKNVRAENRILHRTIDELKKDSQWISVDERLPEQGDCVLCIVEGNECADTNGYGTACFDEFFYRYDSEDGMYEKVTHWKPITPP